MKPRVGILCDYTEENWPSMDLVAEMLLLNLERNHGAALQATQIKPRMRQGLQRIPVLGGTRFANNLQLLAARFYDYPRSLRNVRNKFDLFHIVDHSYSHLLHDLPAGRTVVTCHDLDTFRPILEPERERRSALFRGMTERILSGFRKASAVACDSAATCEEVLKFALFPRERLHVVPVGVHPACTPLPDPRADSEAARLLGPSHPNGLELLHVGSTVPRKRIDVLLRVFAEICKEAPATRLVRVGGPLTTEQAALAAGLRIEHAIVSLPFIERGVLAAIYRRAGIVLQPSAREGFGLPVVEAMACATPVISSDLPVMREVGGDAATYCPVGDIAEWKNAVLRLIAERKARPDEWHLRRREGIRQASKFSWAEHARKMVALYGMVLR